MQSDERHVGLHRPQAVHQIGTDVDRHHLVPEPVQRVLDPRARAQRYLALERAAALQHRDLHPVRRRSSTTFSEGAGSATVGAAAGRPVSVE